MRVDRQLGAMAAYGFVSGLPLPLSGFTFRLWLSDSGAGLALVGLTAWIGLAYSLKFLWSPLLDQPLGLQLLIGLQHGERVHPTLGRDVAHGRQGIAVLQDSVQDHRDHPVADLTVDRLAVVPLWIHRPFRIPPRPRGGPPAMLIFTTDLVLYSTITPTNANPLLRGRFPLRQACAARRPGVHWSSRK